MNKHKSRGLKVRVQTYLYQDELDKLLAASESIEVLGVEASISEVARILLVSALSNKGLP
jgi:hypothetical protein